MEAGREERSKKEKMKKVAEQTWYKPSFWKTAKKHWMLLLMLAPALLYVVIFSYVPMTGIVLAFKNYQYAGGIYGSPWTGLDNFKALLDAGVLTEEEFSAKKRQLLGI